MRPMVQAYDLPLGPWRYFLSQWALSLDKKSWQPFSHQFCKLSFFFFQSCCTLAIFKHFLARARSRTALSIYIKVPAGHNPVVTIPCSSSNRNMGSMLPSGSADLPSDLVVVSNGKQYKVAKEGAAEILDLWRTGDAASSKGSSNSQSVFYNPVQQYNRDLSVLAIRAFGDDLAAVRKVRWKKRSEQLPKGEQRGQKRKRAEVDSVRTEEHPANAESAERDGKASVAETTQVSLADSGGQRSAQEAELVKDEGAQTESQTEIGRSGNHEEAQGVDQCTEKQANSGKTIIHDTTEFENEPVKQPSFRILDALSATGLRALRYAKEIPMVSSITANDLSPSAVASIKLNIEYNKVFDKVLPTTGDAIEHMRVAASRSLGGPSPYHVIDLDPYGTASPFLDTALQALVDGGLLCVTCTDAGVFASIGYLEKTYSQYGGLPLKGAHAHEGGLRLILHAIATSAARYGLAIEPLLSLSIDFYIRVFVRVHRSPAHVKFLASKTMIVYNCDSGCGAWSTQHFTRLKERKARNGDIFHTHTSALAPSANVFCEHCGFKTHQAGPMWGGPLHNPHFIQRILDMLPSLDREIYGTIPRIEGMLSLALHENLEDPSTPNDNTKALPNRPVPTMDPLTRSNHPFFLHPSSLARVLRCIAPSDAQLRSALLYLGYRVTRSHTKAGSMTTDAPWSVVWEIMREWIRQKSPIKKDALRKGTAGWAIMKKDRSRLKLMEAQRQLREAIENPDVGDLEGLKKEVEAALYRISKVDEDSKDGSTEIIDGNYDENGGVILENRNDAEKEEGNSGQVEIQSIPVSKLKIVFDEKLGKEPEGKHKVRYQLNPKKDWGPMNRAKG